MSRRSVSSMPPVVPVIPVGPGEIEHRRLRRLAESLLRHEPGLKDVVIVHDGADPATISADLIGLGLTPTLVKNPRHGRSMPSNDGLACGLTAGYAALAEKFPGAHAWKLDTDAYVIAPCRERIAACFEANPTVGMAGTLDHDCDGTPRAPAFARLADAHEKSLRPVWWWRTTKRVTTTLFGPGRRIAKIYRALDAVHAVRGRYVQGGSYAINGATLAAWQRLGLLATPAVWLGTWVPEDLAFSMWTQIAGFDLGNFNGEGDVFGVKNQGLPLPPADLVARGYGVVHSVKGETWEAERANVDALDATIIPSPGDTGRGDQTVAGGRCNAH